jgi:hypothetical protein
VIENLHGCGPALSLGCISVQPVMNRERSSTKFLFCSLIVSVTGLGLALLITGCERKSKSEKAAEELGEAIEAVGEAVGEAVEEAAEEADGK